MPSMFDDFNDAPAPTPRFDPGTNTYHWIRAEPGSSSDICVGVLPSDVYDRIILLCRIYHWHVAAAAVALAHSAAEDCGKLHTLFPNESPLT